MINSVKGRIDSVYECSFTKNADKDSEHQKDTLMKNNMANRARIGFDKFSNALTIYPAKGLTGDKNANFYEFLTMGTIPYLVGSATLIGVFNYVNKYFGHHENSKASIVGGKMALGVLFYGLAKQLSKPLFTAPVKMATGVDVDLPYKRVIYKLPTHKNDTNITSIEYHKVFESVEFTRWDLLYGDESKGEKRNAYYDKVAKKMGLGENLNDSDQEVKPKIREVVTKTTSAARLFTPLWAACGVGLAFQEPWDNFFKKADLNIFKKSFWNFSKLKFTVKTFGESLKDSAKEFYTGGKNADKLAKHGGKALLGAALLATILSDCSAIFISKKPVKQNSDKVIQKDRKYVVN